MSDEVRHYPTPIARCDEQLTALIEQRRDSQRRLNLVRAVLARQSAGSVELVCRTVRQMPAAYPSTQDATEEALLSQVRVAVE